MHRVQLTTDKPHYVVGQVYKDTVNLTGSWKYMGCYWVKVGD